MSVDPAIEYTFIWHTVMDSKTCLICASLNGLTWKNQSPFDIKLRAQGRDVWDLLADHPLTHPNCRCYIEMQVKVHLDNLKSYTEVGKLIHRVDP